MRGKAGMRRSFPFVTVSFARWATLLAIWALAVVARSAAAQDPQSEMTRSTLAGVYTAKQATAGQEIFESTCLGGCHSLGDHKGMAFDHRWSGHPVSELYNKIYDKMPDDNPGSLSPEMSAQLVAYLLKLNGLPAGKDDLPVDVEVLRKIKIELPK